MVLRDALGVLLYDRKLDDGLLPSMAAMWISDTVEFFADARTLTEDGDILAYGVTPEGNLVLAATMKDVTYV